MYMWDGWDDDWDSIYPLITLCSDCGEQIETSLVRQQTRCFDCQVARICSPGWEVEFMVQINKWDLSQP